MIDAKEKGKAQYAMVENFGRVSSHAFADDKADKKRFCFVKLIGWSSACVCQSAVSAIVSSVLYTCARMMSKMISAYIG